MSTIYHIDNIVLATSSIHRLLYYKQLHDSDLIMMCMLIDDIVLATLCIHNINTLLYYEQLHNLDLIMTHMSTTLCQQHYCTLLWHICRQHCVSNIIVLYYDAYVDNIVSATLLYFIMNSFMNSYSACNFNSLSLKMSNHGQLILQHDNTES
jgi:uncharacterized membrane protein